MTLLFYPYFFKIRIVALKQCVVRDTWFTDGLNAFEIYYKEDSFQ